METQFNLIRKAFCEVMADQFAQAQDAISREDGAGLNKFFKGLSIGSSRNTYGFFMKTVKTAYPKFNTHEKTKNNNNKLGFKDSASGTTS